MDSFKSSKDYNSKDNFSLENSLEIEDLVNDLNKINLSNEEKIKNKIDILNKKSSFNKKKENELTHIYKKYYNNYNPKNIKLDKNNIENIIYYYRFSRGLRTDMIISNNDFLTLKNENSMIIDKIVNLFIKIFEDAFLDEKLIKKINIFNSFLYGFYIKEFNKNNNAIHEIKNKGILKDIFNYHTILIPICENKHWNLVVVKNNNKMGNIFLDSNNKQFIVLPEIYYLDSIKREINKEQINLIKKFLLYLYIEQNKIKVYIDKNNIDMIKTYNIDTEKQKFSNDCGIFIITYTELFLIDPVYFYSMTSKDKSENIDIDLKKWKKAEIFQNQRFEFAKLIDKLYIIQSNYKSKDKIRNEQLVVINEFIDHQKNKICFN